MKLPTNKKERIQVFVLIAIGGVAVLYAGIALGVQPLIAKKKAYKERASELQGKIDAAERKIGSMRRDLEENKESLKTIASETDRYVLRATIGENYLLGVDEMMNRFARAAGVPINPPTEVGISDVPHNNERSGKNVLKAYTAKASLRGGFSDLLRLIREIETNSTYVCISSIMITPQPQDPESHTISMDIQWPVWAEKGMAERIRQQQAEADDAEDKP